MWATMNKNNILLQKGVTQMVDQIFYKDHNLRLSKRKNSTKNIYKRNR